MVDSNILATNLMKEVKTIRRLKGKSPQDSCTCDRIVIYKTYATGHWALQDLYKLSNVLLNVTQTACNNPCDEIKKKKNLIRNQF